MNPRADALYKLGFAAHQSNDLINAEQHYLAALALDSKHIKALYLLGSLYCQTQQYALGLDYLEQTIAINPQHAEAHCNRGNALSRLLRYEEALISHRLAVTLKPDYCDAYYNQGLTLIALQRNNEAIASFEQAVKIDAQHINALNQLAGLLKESNRLDEALHYFQQITQLQSTDVNTHLAKGNAYLTLNQASKAIIEFEKAYVLNQDYYTYCMDRGVAFGKLRQFDQALECFYLAIHASQTQLATAKSTQGLSVTQDLAVAEKSAQISIAYAEYNASIFWLSKGFYNLGWQLYEARWLSVGAAHKRPFSQPLWLGQHDANRVDIRSKRILLHAEQGFGDTIQFSRYATLVTQLGAEVILEVQAALLTLMQHHFPQLQVLAKGASLPAFDYHCPLLSLPLAFKTNVDNIPVLAKPLTADKNRGAVWAKKIASIAGNKKRLGFVCSGSKVHSDDTARSFTMRQLTAIFPEQYAIFCLQKELRAQDENEIHQNTHLHFFGADLHDFADTAALIACMDIVVTVDTSVAHLAASMGKPTWILLPFTPDFRWLLERSDSPWYPSATLYRQTKIGDWTDVLARIKADLINFTS